MWCQFSPISILTMLYNTPNTPHAVCYKGMIKSFTSWNEVNNSYVKLFIVRTCLRVNWLSKNILYSPSSPIFITPGQGVHEIILGNSKKKGNFRDLLIMTWIDGFSKWYFHYACIYNLIFGASPDVLNINLSDFWVKNSVHDIRDLGVISIQ